MYMLRYLVASAALIALPLAAPVQAGTESAPKPAKLKKPKVKKICRASVRTGTRFGNGRVCKSADEWAEHDAKRGPDGERKGGGAMGDVPQ